jgi:hypothetical protein
MIIPRSVLLEMRDVLLKDVEKIRTHFILFLPPPNRAVWETV